MAEQFVAVPESFGRSEDRRLFLNVRRKLWEYEPLRASRPQIDLVVQHGAVQISGRVRTRAMKEIVGYICRRLDGVSSVENNLISDTDVVRSVADSLAQQPDLAPLCLIVDARAGLVTLSGDLPAPELEERAITAARAAPGVLDVISELAVRRASRPPTAPAPVSAATSA